MARALKAVGAKPKAKAKGKGKKQPKSDEPRYSGLNTLTPEDAAEAFEEIFKLHSKLGSVSGEIRKEIADEYATVAKRLDIPKKIVKHLFALEKARREVVKTEAEFDSRERDALLKCAQTFGEDTPFGAFALRAANLAKRDDFAGDSSADGGDELPEESAAGDAGDAGGEEKTETEEEEGAEG